MRVFGPGLEHGVLWNFQSHFFVDTRNAGKGDLTVKVRGARGKVVIELKLIRLFLKYARIAFVAYDHSASISTHSVTLWEAYKKECQFPFFLDQSNE